MGISSFSLKMNLVVGDDGETAILRMIADIKRINECQIPL